MTGSDLHYEWLLAILPSNRVEDQKNGLCQIFAAISRQVN